MKQLIARNWFGYGRWSAPYWFIGMEPGGENTHSYEAWMQLGATELIDCRAHHLASNSTRWHVGVHPPTQPTWRRLIQLLLGFKGERTDLDSVRIYQQNEWGSLEGETAVIWLSALQAKNMQSPVDRKDFRDERIATLRKRLETFVPTFVIFYGTTYRDYYEAIAGVRFNANGYAWNGSTLLMLVMHPTGQSSPKNGDWWSEKGIKLKSLLPADLGSVGSATAKLAAQLSNTRPFLDNDQRHKETNQTVIIEPIKSGLDDVIRVLIDHNPKIGKSYFRFDCYRDGMTIADYRNAVRDRLGDVEAQKFKRDIRWDSDRNFIRAQSDRRSK
ncbi:MAG: hypothetical protein K2P80_08140 [Beijerinckiaceae bacterium]|nr:hypothetical protein [Beijerinckiaceae bacterium]